MYMYCGTMFFPGPRPRLNFASRRSSAHAAGYEADQQLAAELYTDHLLTGNGLRFHKSNKFANFMVAKTCAAAAEKTRRYCTIVNI